ncbi:unnamed protein product, partial [marine sediment metagenome]
FTYFFFVWIFIAINFNIIHLILFGFKDTVACIKEVTYLPFIVGGFAFIANLLTLKAYSMAYVSLVVPIVMLSSLFVVIFGGRFFHERYLLFRVVVSVLMLVGACLIII